MLHTIIARNPDRAYLAEIRAKQNIFELDRDEVAVLVFTHLFGSASTEGLQIDSINPCRLNLPHQDEVIAIGCDMGSGSAVHKPSKRRVRDVGVFLVGRLDDLSRCDDGRRGRLDELGVETRVSIRGEIPGDFPPDRCPRCSAEHYDIGFISMGYLPRPRYIPRPPRPPTCAMGLDQGTGTRHTLGYIQEGYNTGLRR